MAKKILVVGGGGREHAIIKALKKSPDCGEIWCAPGNGGISYDAKCKNIKATDVETMVAFAAEEKFDYVVVAQDDPLALGMVDALAAVGIPEMCIRDSDKVADEHLTAIGGHCHRNAAAGVLVGGQIIVQVDLFHVKFSYYG